MTGLGDGCTDSGGGRPLLSPGVRQRLQRLGVLPDRAPQGSGLGGRLTPSDLPADGDDRWADRTFAPTPLRIDSPAPPLPTAAVLDRARRRMRDLEGSAQLTSATELDLSAVVVEGTSPQAECPARARVVLAAVVAAIHAEIRQHPGLAATSDEQLTALRIPSAIDIGLVLDGSLGAAGRVIVPEPTGRGEPDGIGAAVLGSLDDPSQRVADRTLALPVPVVVHDRLCSGVLLETTLLERPAALAFSLGRLEPRPRTTESGIVAPVWTSMLSVSYDHRVIDGADAARLLAAVRGRLLKLS